MTTPTQTPAAASLAVGQRLVELCRAGKSLEAIDELYAKDIVSLEAVKGCDMDREIAGFDAVRAKTVWFYENHDVHSAELQGPFPHDDRFILFMSYDVTYTGKPMPSMENMPTRMVLNEAGLYTVKDGKITREEFFYVMPGGDGAMP